MTIREASALVGQSQGFGSDFDGGTAAINALETNAKLALTAGVMAYVRDNPAEFTPAQVSIANSDANRAQKNYGAGLVSTDIDLGELASAVGDSAKSVILDPLASVGNGISNLVKWSGYLIPFVAIAAGLFLAWKWTQRAAPPKSSAKP